MINSLNQALPALPNTEGSLSVYLQEIRKFPMLTKEQEVEYSKAWHEKECVDSAHKLVTSHLRLVAKIAMGYKGYGLPISELISEGNIGLMQAVKKFDPDRGFRLATYAMWWIKASMQEFILHSWSLVKMGTTAAQKRLFFNLRKMKVKLKVYEEGELSPQYVTKIADELSVSETEVINMNRRLSSPDHSLNAPLKAEGEGEWMDWLVDEEDDQETALAKTQEKNIRSEMLGKAMDILNDREKDILIQRRLIDKARTLEDLSNEYGISRERVRQIENRAFEKIQKEVQTIAMADYADHMQVA